MDKAVGVLALQGAYQKHIDMLQTLGVAAQTVRQPHELDGCSALIIPGGESTTNPPGDTTLAPDAHLVMLGSVNQHQEFKDRFD